MVLGFGSPSMAMNVEHILCKVARWHKRLHFAKMGDYLENSAAQAIQDRAMFTQGENKTDAKALPFPHIMSDEAMKVSIAETLVCVQNFKHNCNYVN